MAVIIKIEVPLDIETFDITVPNACDPVGVVCDGNKSWALFLQNEGDAKRMEEGKIPPSGEVLDSRAIIAGESVGVEGQTLALLGAPWVAEDGTIRSLFVDLTEKIAEQREAAKKEASRQAILQGTGNAALTQGIVKPNR